MTFATQSQNMRKRTLRTLIRVEVEVFIWSLAVLAERERLKEDETKCCCPGPLGPTKVWARYKQSVSFLLEFLGEYEWDKDMAGQKWSPLL